MPQPYKKRMMLALLTVVLLGGLGVWFILIMRVANSNDHVRTLRSTLQEELVKERQFTSLENLTRNTALERESLGKALVAKDDVASVIENVESLGNTTGLRLTVELVGVENIPDTKNDTRELLTLSLQTAGTWAGTMYFLSLIEGMPYKVSVTSMDFEKVTLSTAEAEKPVFKGEWKGTIRVAMIKEK